MLGEGFVAQSTHDVTVVGRRVVKHYRSWDEGEPEREWAGLTLLHRFAPGWLPSPWNSGWTAAPRLSSCDVFRDSPSAATRSVTNK